MSSIIAYLPEHDGSTTHDEDHPWVRYFEARSPEEQERAWAEIRAIDTKAAKKTNKHGAMMLIAMKHRSRMRTRKPSEADWQLNDLLLGMIIEGNELLSVLSGHKAKCVAAEKSVDRRREKKLELVEAVAAKYNAILDKDPIERITKTQLEKALGHKSGKLNKISLKEIKTTARMLRASDRLV